MTEPTVTPARPRSGRWRRLRLILLLGLLVLLVAYTGADLWTARRLAAEIARLEARYGIAVNGRLVSPSVPAADNRARLVKAATALMIPESEEQRKAMNGFGAISETPAVPGPLRAFVEANKEAIDVASTIGTRTLSSWEIEYNGDNSPPLLEVRSLSNVLYVQAMLGIEAGRPDEAARTIASALLVSSSLNREPQLIAQLIRIAVADRHFTAIRRLLMHAEPSQGALEELARALTENRPSPMQIGFESELMYGSRVLARVEGGRRTPEMGPSFGYAPWPGVLGRLGRPIVRIAHLRFLRNMDRLLSVEAGPRPRPAGQLFPQPAPWHLIDRFAGLSLPGLERAAVTGDQFMTTLGATEIAVALRRYRIDRGSYPDMLSDLVPAYVDRLPIDAFTGQSPEYVRTGSGFTLTTRHGDRFGADKRPPAKWQITK